MSRVVRRHEQFALHPDAEVTTWLLCIVGLLVFSIAAWVIEGWLAVSARSSGKLLGLVLAVGLLLVFYGARRPGFWELPLPRRS